MSAEPEKLLVPAELYDEALVFCNARRADKGLKPITELPAGYGAQSWPCPCANAVPGLRVNLSSWHFVGSVADTYSGPFGFVQFFDEHAKVYVLTLPVRDGSLKEESRNG